MHRLHSLTLATALAVGFTGASAASAQAPRPQDSAAGQKSGQQSGTATSEDTQFVQKAAASGRMEVEHGKMAASKASNAQVKAFGNTLVKDHTAANQELMAIAKRKNITMADRMVTNQASPAGGSATSATADTKSGASRTQKSGTTGTTGASGGVATTGEARDRQAGAAQQAGAGQQEPWMSATGAAFDRGFIEAQVKAHQEAIALFEKQSNSGNDGDLKAFAQKQLPALRNHLKQAQDLQAKLKSTN
jgi:putative membrane protein